jgi:hypothetical protein
MDWKNPKSVETRIVRLEREIAAIDRYFYLSNESTDRVGYAGMLERKRDDMVRSTVLQLHTGIEDLLDSMIVSLILETSAEDRKRRLSSSRGGRYERCFMVLTASDLTRS